MWEFFFYFYLPYKMAELNLFGSYECTADAKGRVMLPAAVKTQLKKVMKQGFVIKQSIFSKSLELYPIASWSALSAQVNRLNKFVKKNVEFIRMFNYGVRSVELDDSGRFLIPSDLMDFAAIKKDVVIVAQQDRMEIWDKKAYDKFIKENNARFEELAQDVMGGISTEEPDDKK
ncbi:MAG TPA: division/cell wall cluster transcriptional repressor MraZ [Bacteroidia bacterium]